MTILFLLAGMFVGLSCLVAGLMFAVWAFGEHREARKYRGLVAQATKLKAQQAVAPPAAVGNQWIIEYKEGRAHSKVIIAASTEALALKEFAKRGVRYQSIVGINLV